MGSFWSIIRGFWLLLSLQEHIIHHFFGLLHVICPDHRSFGGQTLLLLGKPKQSAGMALAEAALAYYLYRFWGQFQQAQLVCDRTLSLADFFGGLLLSEPVFVDETAQRQCLLKEIQILPLQILHHRHKRAAFFVGLQYVAGHLPQSRQLGCHQPPLPRYQLESSLFRAADGQRRYDPTAFNALGQLREGIGIEYFARLIGVWGYIVDGDLAKITALQQGHIITPFVPRITQGNNEYYRKILQNPRFLQQIGLKRV
jgi:hypothetical protein